MKKTKITKLRKSGWKAGSASDFLRLSPEEEAFIELKLELAKYLKNRRLKHRLTQAQLASKLHSSQSRVAKMEAGDPTVTVDLLIRSLLSLGTSPKQLGKILSSLQTS